jgi:hypothetical protein
MKKYTVLLLYPIHMQFDPEQPQTYQAWENAEFSTQAVIFAQAKAAREHEDVGDGSDFYPLAVYEGHQEDILGPTDERDPKTGLLEPGYGGDDE